MGIETEIKIKIENPRKIRKKVIALGAKFLGRQRQLDIYFDSQDERVQKSDQVRKLRLQGKTAILTYKGPRRTTDIKDGVHRRLEIETSVEDAEKARAILAGWGHKEGDQAEKIRETFRCKDLQILIDYLPFIGWWIELEGEKEKITKTATRLGLDILRADKRHYGEIFADFCQITGCPFESEMTFEKEKVWLLQRREAREWGKL